jgi:hypothetical protein
MSAYATAGHRIQTAIAVLMGRDPSFSLTQPKHMRVGLDLSKSDAGGLARLLIAKGVFTEAEYIEAITASAEQEADSYERMVQATLGHRGIRTA